jgi:hypothetical protein
MCKNYNNWLNATFLMSLLLPAAAVADSMTPAAALGPVRQPSAESCPANSETSQLQQSWTCAAVPSPRDSVDSVAGEWTWDSERGNFVWYTGYWCYPLASQDCSNNDRGAAPIEWTFGCEWLSFGGPAVAVRRGPALELIAHGPTTQAIFRSPAPKPLQAVASKNAPRKKSTVRALLTKLNKHKDVAAAPAQPAHPSIGNGQRLINANALGAMPKPPPTEAAVIAIVPSVADARRPLLPPPEYGPHGAIGGGHEEHANHSESSSEKQPAKHK